jgi:ATP/maltotriose-dependent transcriptional regulator MalT/DNA-binding SARP family transcriptional activator
MIGGGHIPPMQASAANPIDTHQLGFLSYAPPVGGRLGMEELRVSVEPEIDDRIADDAERVRPSFPLRPGKIQRPLLPPETLRRDRLFDWLAARASHRVVYIVAEAGFGKTTLIADYLRRSRLRTFWYRLDEDDTDGLVFLRYLIAACQAVDPRLLRRSAALLSESTIEPTREETVLRTLLAEMDCLSEVPSALVLDDLHVAESVPAIGAVIERIIARAPERLSLILASRRTPSLSAAALRARGELAELGREDLRFDELETGQLFRESYHHPLEPDVLHDLQARTEGWAASLQLVKAAVDGRSPAQVREFVRSISGAEGDLYDYLAEEVVGELRGDIRRFLMRVALLEEIDPTTAAVAAGVPGAEARLLLGHAQRLGLLSKGAGSVASWRLHPLVREFLLARLEAELGRQGIIDLHRGLASALEPQSWRLAARHWAAAGDADQIRRVVCAAVPSIIGTGDFAAAEDFITRFPDPDPNPWYDIIRARIKSATGHYEEALELALQAARHELAGEGSDSSLTLANALNLLHYGVEMHDPNLCSTAYAQLVGSDDTELAAIARATRAILEAAGSGSLDNARHLVLETARVSEERGHRRHEAIAWVNLANLERARGDATASLEAGMAALRSMPCGGNQGDLQAAHLNTAKGLAHLGRWELALTHMDAALENTQAWKDPEVIGECAELHAMYGDPGRAAQILARAFAEEEQRRGDPLCRHVAARLMLLEGNLAHARELLDEATGPTCEVAFRSSWLALDVGIRALDCAGDSTLVAAIEEASQFAAHQQAWYWWKNIRLTKALVSANDELAVYLSSLEPADAAYLSIQAELVVRRLADLDQEGLAIVRQEASQRPERWRWAVRQLLSSQSVRPTDLKRAAEFLDCIGDSNDIKLLRGLAKRKSLRIPDAGLALTRRLAPQAFIDDLGRVTVHVGDRVLPGTEIRKKVLSLLTFLLTRPQFTASREQVIEALWPRMEPEAGANSLNQTSYFLRQVFEPTTTEDATAGYLNSRADLIWLDPELVRSRSSNCLKVIGAMRRDPSPELVTTLAESYTGRFAVDFIYDDWASAFRDTLHASFLDRIERAVTADTKAGAFDRALSVAQLALQADPDAEQIELCLLRLYRRTGAHAAAAEQYAHYASVMREQLGIEPPPLESI